MVAGIEIMDGLPAKDEALLLRKEARNAYPDGIIKF